MIYCFYLYCGVLKFLVNLLIKEDFLVFVVELCEEWESLGGISCMLV